MDSLLLTYAAGAVVALWRTDGTVGMRMALAALWPLGVVAAAVTTVILLTAAAILFPLFGLVLAAGLAGGWWWLS